MSSVNPLYQRDPDYAERLRDEFIENEPKLLATLREEMDENRGKFLSAALGTAYNYVPYPRFEQVGPLSDLHTKIRVQVALEGLDAMIKEHRALTQGRHVLVLEDGDEQLLLEALSALRKTKEQAYRTSQSLPQFQSLTERDFGIPKITALEERISIRPEPQAELAADLAPEVRAPTKVPVERTYSSAVREIEIELPGGQTATWSINPGLSTRHGELDDCMVGPEVELLRSDSGLLKRLGEQMVDEMSFIAVKDGEYGVLYESEFPVVGDEVIEDQSQMVERAVMLEALRLQAPLLAEQYPAVQFALIPQAEAAEGRPGLWAWVKDGALCQRDLKGLANSMLEISAHLSNVVASRPAAGL